jgi:hypothetical protein
MSIRAIKTAETEIACRRIKSLVRKVNILPKFEPSKDILAKREYMQTESFWSGENQAKYDTFVKSLNK